MSWLTEGRVRSLRTKIWGAGLSLLVKIQDRKTYSFQTALPRQYVPSLRGTLRKTLQSLKLTLSEREYEELESESRSFLSLKGGYVLHMLLILRSWLENNYVTEWWTKYIYLFYRETLIGNSCYFAMDYHNYVPPGGDRFSRAAMFIYKTTEWRDSLMDEKVEPLLLRDLVPLCMMQYKRMLGTTRVPQIGCDKIIHVTRKEGSNHIAVMCRDRYYKLNVYDNETGRQLSPDILLRNLKEIYKDAETYKSDERKNVASLTSWTRDEWAEARTKLMKDNKSFNNLLNMIETSICCFAFVDFIGKSSSDFANYMISCGGDNVDMWLDRSLNMVSFPDARVGFVAEHSPMDGTPMAHMWEWVIHEEHVLGYKDGCPNVQNENDCTITENSVWEYYDIDYDSQLHSYLKETDRFLSKTVRNTMTMYQSLFTGFGQDKMKKLAKTSPDAFFQLAIQLAWYRMNKRIVLQYEPCMMRLYRDGRTDTIRAATEESVRFVTDFDNDKLSFAEKQNLLKASTVKHSTMIKEYMGGEGGDRHLFGLTILASGLNAKLGIFEKELAFLKRILGYPWVISTSQVPQSQMERNKDILNDEQLYPGLGGFSAVDKNGYGIGYCFLGDYSIMINVSSHNTCKETCSIEFHKALTQALNDMLNIYVPPDVNATTSK